MSKGDSKMEATVGRNSWGSISEGFNQRKSRMRSTSLFSPRRARSELFERIPQRAQQLAAAAIFILVIAKKKYPRSKFGKGALASRKNLHFRPRGIDLYNVWRSSA